MIPPVKVNSINPRINFGSSDNSGVGTPEKSGATLNDVHKAAKATAGLMAGAMTGDMTDVTCTAAKDALNNMSEKVNNPVLSMILKAGAAVASFVGVFLLYKFLLKGSFRTLKSLTDSPETAKSAQQLKDLAAENTAKFTENLMSVLNKIPYVKNNEGFKQRILNFFNNIGIKTQGDLGTFAAAGTGAGLTGDLTAEEKKELLNSTNEIQNDFKEAAIKKREATDKEREAAVEKMLNEIADKVVIEAIDEIAKKEAEAAVAKIVNPETKETARNAAIRAIGREAKMTARYAAIEAARVEAKEVADMDDKEAAKEAIAEEAKEAAIFAVKNVASAAAEKAASKVIKRLEKQAEASDVEDRHGAA